MTAETYKLIHLTGIILIIAGLISLLSVKMSGGNLQGKIKSLIYASHGLGLFLAILGGFGLLARLGLMHEMPNWVYAKLVIWLYFAGIIAVVKRKGQQAGFALFTVIISVFMLSGYLALFKPF